MPSTNEMQVMLIDDHDIALFVTQHLLNTLGIPTKTSLQPSGFSAIEFIRENLNSQNKLPDLILLDINMPVLNGWEFLEDFEKLKGQINKPIKIYVLSGQTKPEKFNLWQDKGVVSGYFFKPLKINDLRNILNVVKAEMN